MRFCFARVESPPGPGRSFATRSDPGAGRLLLRRRAVSRPCRPVLGSPFNPVVLIAAPSVGAPLSLAHRVSRVSLCEPHVLRETAWLFPSLLDTGRVSRYLFVYFLFCSSLLCLLLEKLVSPPASAAASSPSSSPSPQPASELDMSSEPHQLTSKGNRSLGELHAVLPS